ncbi:centrosomal protein of 41 kDa [Protopterus annectens]|uniref:centrosomal protein of 41 kDa n=1 Tax=Protopterus annectens TaxID=7888 RepID=UPI001CFA2AF4|nr:centrosomal protein of 41 kDa [Protopterus annectens]
MEKLEELNRNYRYRNDELFKRLKISTFSQLVTQVASLSELNEDVNNEELLAEGSNSPSSEFDELSQRANGEGGHEDTIAIPCPNSNMGAEEPVQSVRSTLQSVISGVGEMDLEKDTEKKSSPAPTPSPSVLDKPYPDCPYLLLDVRDRDAYEQCHIIGAYCYPITMLSRTMNPYTSEVLEYKNASGRIIILYDEDERIATQAATTMCERGFENLFMLSGGLKVLTQKFPEGFTTGSLPASCLQPSQVASVRKLANLREPVQHAENKWRFTREDLDKIQQCLDEMLISSNSSSRLSTGRIGSTISAAATARSSQAPSSASSVSVRSQSSRVHSKPWK